MMKESRRRRRGKAPFLAAYDERGAYICDYMVVAMSGGRTAVLPVTPRMKGYYRRLMGPYMAGERRTVWRGWRADMLRGLVADPGSARRQEAAFYRTLRPLIDGMRRGEKVRALQKVGVLRKPRTTYITIK